MTNFNFNDFEHLLLNFRPVEKREKSIHKRMLSLLRTTEDPLCRHQYTPGHFTASSFILSPNKSHLLLIFHSKLRRWLQPGGHVDPSDLSILDAAKREIREEVDLTDLHLINNQYPIFDLDIHPIIARKSEPEHLHFDIRFSFCAQNTNFRAASDAIAGKWFPLNQISASDSDESVIRAVTKLLEPLKQT